MIEEDTPLPDNEEEELVESPTDIESPETNAETTYTVTEAIEYCGFGRFQTAMLFITGLAWMADAMEILLIGFVLPILARAWGVDELTQAPFIASASFVGMFIGAFMWGQISDKFGRKHTLWYASAFTGVSALIAVFTSNWVLLCVSRFFTGIGVGSAHVPFSLYSELLPTKYRGTMLLYMQILFNVGAVTASALAWILLPMETVLGIDAFRVFMLACTFPCVMLVIIVPFIPESPRYLFVKERYDEADIVLQKMMKWNGKLIMEGQLARTIPIDLEEEATPVEENTQKTLVERIKTLNVYILFTKPYRRIALTLMGMFFAVTFCYYGVGLLTPAYFQTQGEGNGYMEVFITALAEAPGIVIAALLIDRIGRKKSQMVMLFVCSVFLFLLAIPGPLWLLTIFAVMTRLTANGAFGVIYVLTPELFPTVLRGTGLGVCMSFSRLGGVATPYVATTLFKVNTWLPLVIYGVACLIAGVLTITIPKETAGQHLKDNYAEENQSEL